ncbi:hypothetical protein MUP79_05670 [Candidatus Bathyarchaeota archaeon]|nr:hypothetical protein [Candidatus Bathyarchaeota archaeon]
MTEKPKTETAMDSTVKVQLASITLDNARLTTENTRLADENKALKKQNVELASVIENDLKADLKLKVMAKSSFKESDLEPLKVEQLQQIDETLSRGKGIDTTTPSYKSIHAGNDAQTGRTTVGDLYGKTREQILAMKGDF